MVNTFTNGLITKLGGLQSSNKAIFNVIAMAVEPLLEKYYEGRQDLFFTSSTEYDSSHNLLLQYGIIFLRVSNRETRTMEIRESMVAKILVDYFLDVRSAPNHAMMIAKKALGKFEVRKWCPSAGGFGIEEVFKAQLHIHQTQTSSLHEAFANFPDLPQWMMDESLKFEYNPSTSGTDLINALLPTPSLFHMFLTTPEYGPDFFLICRIKGLWYCISGAIKLYSSPISKEMRLKNWAAANPGLMFRKLNKPVASGQISIESFQCPQNALGKHQNFHDRTEQAFNWYDTDKFQPHKLGGAVIMNILLSPAPVTFDALSLPNDERIFTLNIDWNNCPNFFLHDYLRAEIQKTSPHCATLVLHGSLSSPSFQRTCQFSTCSTRHKTSTKWFLCPSCSFALCPRHLTKLVHHC